MKLIDFHTHFFPNKLFDAIWQWFEAHAWPIKYKIYADDIVTFLKNAGVNRCVALHYPHKKDISKELNDWIYQLSQKYSGFMIPFGSLHPDDENKEKILRSCFEEYQFKGLKFHCHVQKMSPNDSRMEIIYKICNEREKIVLIHAGSGPHFKERPTNGYGYDVESITGYRLFEKVLKKYPKIKFVVPHLGYEEIEAFINLLGDYPNLHLDTTMALADFFPMEFKKEWVSDNADRILFGTDFPNIPYEWNKERDRLLSLGLGKEKEEKILWRNAAGLLGMKEMKVNTA